MSELEDKLNAVLGDPQMMKQIMSLANDLGTRSQTKEEQPRPEGLPDLDLGLIQKLSGFAKQGQIDKDQRTLLHALGPYLSRERLSKLEKAMRAAKMARMASGLLSSGGL